MNIARLALPDDKDVPTIFGEFVAMQGIALYIPRQFRMPVGRVRFGPTPVQTGFRSVLMPETSMHEDDFAAPLENNIRLAG